MPDMMIRRRLQLIVRLVWLVTLAAQLPLEAARKRPPRIMPGPIKHCRVFSSSSGTAGSSICGTNSPATGHSRVIGLYANGWDALLDGVERTGARNMPGDREFLSGPEARGLVSYYDDECWMTLTLGASLRADHQRGLPESGAGVVCGCADRLGHHVLRRDQRRLWWDKAHTQKATAANAGAALAGARLYRRTTLPRTQLLRSRFIRFGGRNMVDQGDVSGLRSHQTRRHEGLVEVHLQRRL